MAVPGLTAPVPGLFTARYAGGSIILGGVDILAGLVGITEGAGGNNVISFGYTDNTSDLADDLAVEIADPARTWMETYVPRKGSECNAIIRVANWTGPGDNREFDCGAMWVDEVSLTGPPNMVTVKATSIPAATGLKSEKQYQFWEGMPLMAIAAQTAAEYGLTTVWDTAKNPTFKRTDIHDMSHLEYLRDRCKDEGLSLKIFNRQLIVYSEEEYEARPAVYTIVYGESQILAYGFTSKLDDTFSAATNAYVSPETGDLIEGTFEPEEPPEGAEAELMLNERVEAEEEGAGGEPELREDLLDAIDYSNQNAAAAEAAQKKAKNKLRGKNKREKEGVIMMLGNPGYLSGLNTEIRGFGPFDGKWFIYSSAHLISEDGYRTELRLRGALKGY